MAEELRCRACGKTVGSGDRFCASCGARLDDAASAGEERKLVSAVFVDLVGFAHLTESLDPEDTRRLLDAYWGGAREEIERHGGTVEKFIGDAVVGLFGAPRSHDDDAERAVRAALAVLDRTRGGGAPQVRIAVATGLALVDRDARPEAGEALVVGDVVTTAARLQEAAPTAAVFVDASTHAATSDAIRYVPVRAVEAKGRTEPIAAWRALGILSRLRRPAPVARFVGRDHELSLLDALVARSRTERAVGLVTIVGEPGIGKSRLVRELPAPGVERWIACVPSYAEGCAFAPLADLLRERAGIRERDDDAVAAARLDGFLVELLPDRGERSIVGRHVRRLVGLDPAAAGDDALEGFAAWRRVFESAAALRPLVLVLEDVHWADDALLDFVEHLAEWVVQLPLVVICTARPELLRRRPGWGGGLANAFTLSLGPLSDDETAALVADVLDREPVARERSELVARAGGNPLYAEQLARMLREGGDLGADVPETLRAVIAARLDRLAPPAKRLLHDASVVGGVFSGDALEALGGPAGDDRGAALHELVRLELVERRGSDDEWAFRHRLVREVAYAELPRTARVEKHLRVAEWLEGRRRPEDGAGLVAHHYVRAREEAAAAGGVPREELEEKARTALARAADRALGLNAFASAARLYAQALDLWPAGGKRRAALLLRYAYALWHAEVSGEAVALEARDALAAAGDAEGEAEAEVLLSELRWYRGDRAAATEHLDRAVELVAAGPPSVAKARVLSRLSRSQMLSACYPDAIATGREALALAERLGLDELRAEALNSIGSARVRSGDRDGIADLRLAIEVAGDTRAAVVAYNNLAALLMESGDRHGAEEAELSGCALAERLGDRLHVEWFCGGAVGRRFGAGDWDDVLAAAGEWLATSRHQGYVAIGVLMARALVLHARDDPSAHDDLARAESLVRAAGDPQTLTPTLAALAFLLLAEGRTAAARVRAEEALARCEQSGDVPPLALFDLAVACVDTGLGERLRSCLAAVTAPSRWVELARHILDGDLVCALELVHEPEEGWLAAVIRLRSAERGGPGLEEALAYFRAAGATRWIRRCEAVRARSALATAS